MLEFSLGNMLALLFATTSFFSLLRTRKLLKENLALRKHVSRSLKKIDSETCELLQKESF